MGVVELADGSLLVGGPKTQAGRRVVAVPTALLDGIREHMTKFVGPAGTALVFTGFKGARLRRSNFQTYWTAAVEGAGLAKGVHFHDLRHTGNTLRRSVRRAPGRPHGEDGPRESARGPDLPAHDVAAGPQWWPTPSTGCCRPGARGGHDDS